MSSQSAWHMGNLTPAYNYKVWSAQSEELKELLTMNQKKKPQKNNPPPRILQSIIQELIIQNHLTLARTDLANLLYFPHSQSLIRRLHIFSEVLRAIKLREKENLPIGSYLGF